MIDLVLWIGALVFLVALWLWSRHLHSRKYESNGSCIYVHDVSKADFWDGKEPPDTGFTAAQKKEIYARVSGRCQVTGKAVSLGEPDGRGEKLRNALGLLPEGEVDHIIPRNYGGPSTTWNARLVCREVNRGKSGLWTHEAEKLCEKRRMKVYVVRQSAKRAARPMRVTSVAGGARRFFLGV